MKASFNRKKNVFHQQTLLTFRKKMVNCYTWSAALYGAEICIVRKYQKYQERFEMWCWRRMEKISWTDHVRNEVLHRVKEERNIMHTVKRRKPKWICHILCRSCLIKHVTEGNIGGGIEVTVRQERRSKQLLDNLKERRG
jgi:hypothetical protein